MNKTVTYADKPKSSEWKVLVTLALFLLILEAFTRGFAGSLSLDLRNTLEIPKTAARIARAPEEVRTVLVVGNSLARCGVDLDMLSKSTILINDGKTRSASAELFAPDASSVVQWDWGIRRYFTGTDSHPDVILLLTGRADLLDLPTSAETLASYYVGTSDFTEAIESMQDSEEAIRLVLGATSRLLANRDRIRPRICYRYLPGFKTTWPVLTETNDSETVISEHSENRTTKSLERLIATAREMGSDLQVISVPLPETYSLPEPVLRLLEKSEVPYHNLSKIPGIDSARFPDDYHLDQSGARIFTRALLNTFKDEQE